MKHMKCTNADLFGSFGAGFSVLSEITQLEMKSDMKLQSDISSSGYFKNDFMT